MFRRRKISKYGLEKKVRRSRRVEVWKKFHGPRNIIVDWAVHER